MTAGAKQPSKNCALGYTTEVMPGVPLLSTVACRPTEVCKRQRHPGVARLCTHVFELVQLKPRMNIWLPSCFRAKPHAHTCCNGWPQAKAVTRIALVISPGILAGIISQNVHSHWDHQASLHWLRWVCIGVVFQLGKTIPFKRTWCNCKVWHQSVLRAGLEVLIHILSACVPLPGAHNRIYRYWKHDQRYSSMSALLHVSFGLLLEARFSFTRLEH